MAAKYCPRWLFNLCASMTAYEFIIGDMPIKSYAKKFSGGLSEHYGEIKHEEIESTAEVMLRFLVEINAENSDELLNAFVFFHGPCLGKLISFFFRLVLRPLPGKTCQN